MEYVIGQAWRDDRGLEYQVIGVVTEGGISKVVLHGPGGVDLLSGARINEYAQFNIASDSNDPPNGFTLIEG